jgi:uncharacterized protein YcfJ
LHARRTGWVWLGDALEIGAELIEGDPYSAGATFIGAYAGSVVGLACGAVIGVTVVGAVGCYLGGSYISGAVDSATTEYFRDQGYPAYFDY